MSDWYSDLSAPPAAPAAAPPKPAGGPSWYEDLTAPPQIMTQGSGRPPRPIGDRLDRSATTMQATVGSLAPDTSGQIGLLSQRMGIPVSRFGVANGEIVYADENGELQRAIPTVTGGGWRELIPRLSTNIGAAAGPALPQIIGGGVGAATTPLGAPASIGAATGSAAVTDTIRQIVANQLLGRPQWENFDPLNAAGQGAMAGGGQAVGMGANALFRRNPLGVNAADKVAAMDPATRQAIADLEREAARRGVDLSAGQATGMRSLQVQERRLSRFDETADRMAEFATNQREIQIPRAIREEIARLSPASGEAAIQAFREGGGEVLRGLKAARDAGADALYTEAFQANQAVASPAIDRLLVTPAGKEALQRAVVKMQNQMSLVGRPDPELTAAMREAAELGKMDYVPGGVASGLKLRTLDYVKRALGDMEAGALSANNRDDARIFGELRRGLTRELDRLDVTAAAGPNSLKPGGGAYARARREYGTGQDVIEQVLEDGIGKLKDMDGPARRRIVTGIFSGENLMPEAVGRMRQQFVAAGRLDDWNAGVSAFLSDKLRAATVEGVQGASMGNVPGKFRRTVWGDEVQRDIVKAALGDPTRIQGMEKLMQVLEAASKTLPEGSPTATDMGAMGANAIGKGARLVGKALSPQTYLNLGSELAEGYAALRTPAARERLAEALLSGDYARELAQLRMLNPTGEKAVAVVGQILTGAGLTGARSAAQSAGFGPRDFDPPALPVAMR